MSIIDGIVTGDDVELPVQLYKNKGGVDEVFNISEGATVKVAVISLSGIVLVPTQTCKRTAQGAVWSKSLVIVEIPASLTKGLSAPLDAQFEIQVQDPKRLSWFEAVHIYKGTINQ